MKSCSDEELLGKFDIDDISPDALLFQTGNLTICGVEENQGENRYLLVYPNLEVERHMNAGQFICYKTGQILFVANIFCFELFPEFQQAAKIFLLSKPKYLFCRIGDIVNCRVDHFFGNIFLPVKVRNKFLKLPWV